MEKIFIEKNGDRKFERISRWNALDYTLVTRKHKLAQYTDNYNSNDEKLNLTCFKVGTQIYPLRMFGKLATSIVLTDRSILSRVDPESGLYLELNGDKTKVRMYREVIST